ncbi:hypothetical protein ACVGVM_16520 [Pseudonocardia bannensis]|uniref:Peptide zinc metalloprotease protein n=1 Tax=Pseudonocardia bannensis TaxID=630973 RepID=A0A848DR70_9PSEU|nr:hypothetical protein [Pseudonocardia bannensis]NMH95292.1 hypothetical protein [Pseudonocardia bannensis]
MGIEHHTGNPTLAPPGTPRLVEGTELIGEYQGSGFAEPTYLARRDDGQVLQLSRLVYLLATLVDGHRDRDELAAAFGAELDREVSVEQVAFLLDDLLRPAGLVTDDAVPGSAAGGPGATPPDADGPSAEPAPADRVTRPDPLLMLKYRAGLISERRVWTIAGVFRPLFHGPVVAVMLAAFVLLDILIVAGGALGRVVSAADAFIDRPGLTLFVLALIVAAGGFHECGHVAACRYGGARPGVMGIGLYLVWPAFYSTVTDAYRLDRGARLRVDLGGVYFNAIFLTGLGAAYLLTGSPWLLVALVVMHIETLWQFLPSVRLDGYYILADLVGVPDLFARMGPVLRSALPGRSTHPRVAELKPWCRRIVTLWVALVIPCLVYWVVAFIVLAPRVLPAAWSAVRTLIDAVAADIQNAHVAAATLGIVNLLLLVLPYVGLALVAGHLARGLHHSAVRAYRARRPKHDGT